MRIKVEFAGTVYKVKEDSFHDDRTNKDIAYFKAIVEQDNDIAILSATKEVAEILKKKLMQDYSLTAEYDTERKTFRLINAVLWEAGK